MQTQGLLQKDDWLGGFMGCPVFCLNMDDSIVHDPSAVNQTKRILLERPCFAYAKAGTREHQKIALLEEMGFRLIDTNVSLERGCRSQSEWRRAAHVRFATAKDREAVKTIARESFAYSRFHLDPMIDNETANRIKAGWAENFFNGMRGDYLVAGSTGSVPNGFLLLLRSGADLVIDLIAVAEGSRRQGLAAAMVAYAEKEIPTIHRVLVGTQIANIPSIRLYEKLGFRVSASSYVFHFHHKG